MEWKLIQIKIYITLFWRFLRRKQRFSLIIFKHTNLNEIDGKLLATCLENVIIHPNAKVTMQIPYIPNHEIFSVCVCRTVQREQDHDGFLLFRGFSLKLRRLTLAWFCTYIRLMVSLVRDSRRPTAGTSLLRSVKFEITRRVWRFPHRGSSLHRPWKLPTALSIILTNYSYN